MSERKNFEGCLQCEPTAKMIKWFNSENFYSTRDEDVKLFLFDPV